MKMAVGHGLPRPVKLTGLAAMFRLRRRTAGVFLAPVMACNLRCRMCYFSDPKKRAQMKLRPASSGRGKNISKKLNYTLK